MSVHHTLHRHGNHLPFAASIVLLAIGIVMLIGLGGCYHYEPQSDSSGAEEYYNSKYGVSAHVSDSHNIGTSDLFGMRYYGTSYTMSDGNTVVYHDNLGYFRDDRQSAEIEQAARDYIDKLVSTADALQKPEVETIGYHQDLGDSSPSIWRGRYDGDIEKLFCQEHPYLGLGIHSGSDSYGDAGDFTYEVAYEPEHARDADRIYTQLGKIFQIDITCLLAQPSYYHAGKMSLLDDGAVKLVHFSSDADGNVSINEEKPHFISTGTPLDVSWAEEDRTFADGDFKMQQVGENLWKVSMEKTDPQSPAPALYLRNNSDEQLILRKGTDDFMKLADPRSTAKSYSVEDESLLLWGHIDELTPKCSVTDARKDIIVIRYDTKSKNEITSFEMTANVLVSEKESGKYATDTMSLCDIPLMDTREDKGGWTCFFGVPDNIVEGTNSVGISVVLNGEEPLRFDDEIDIR